MDLLAALYAAGVDNWDGYSLAMATLKTDASDEDILDALISYGVDNWEGYEYAQDLMG